MDFAGVNLALRSHVLSILRKAQAEQVDLFVIYTPFVLIFLHQFCKFAFLVFSHA